VRQRDDDRDDAALVRACRTGETAAWEALIRRYRRLIYSIPVAYRLRPEDADEVFQRVAVKLFERLDQIRREESVAAWLMATTRRECQQLRVQSQRWAPIAERVEEDLAEDPPDVVHALDTVRAEHALVLAFERLDEPCRKLLGALYLEDPAPSYDDLSRRLGRPVGSLGPTRARCLGKLRALYVRGGGQEP